MLIELPTADEIDSLAITTPSLEVRKIVIDLEKRKADLNYAPCKGQVVLAVRGEDGLALVRRQGDESWSLPSDRIGPSEDVGKSPRRVAKEQCGLMLRTLELAGIYDVLWHYSDVSVKRLHFVYSAITDDRTCAPQKERGIIEAKFFKELPGDIRRNEIQNHAVADCSGK